jgi:23S rRNA (adenine1618-N6)-methyltransferase
LHRNKENESEKRLPKRLIYITKSDRFGYNFEELIEKSPELKPFVSANKHNRNALDIDFNPDAVKSLNKALLLALRHSKLGYS